MRSWCIWSTSGVAVTINKNQKKHVMRICDFGVWLLVWFKNKSNKRSKMAISTLAKMSFRKGLFLTKNSFSFVSTRTTTVSIFSVSRSDFDYVCEAGVFAEPVLEWNSIFVLRSKILRSFNSVICSTNSSSHCLSRECGTYTFNKKLPAGETNVLCAGPRLMN